MDQIKIGGFLKDLRKEKGITQEQLAEKLGVSGRLFRYAYGISEALIYVTVVMFPLYTTGLLSKLRISRTNYKFNSIPWPLMKVMAFIVAFAVAALIRILISKIFG